MSGSIKSYFSKSLTRHEGRQHVRAVKLTNRNVDSVISFIASFQGQSEMSVGDYTKAKANDPFKLRVKTPKGWRVAKPGLIVARFKNNEERVKRTGRLYEFVVYNEEIFNDHFEHISQVAFTSRIPTL